MGFGEEKESALKQKLATEELHLLISKEMLVEIEHVEAHRTKKDKKEMSQFEKFVFDGNEKADELATARAMLDGGLMAETRAKTVQRERRSVRSLAARSQLSLFGRRMKRLAEAERKMDFRG